MPTQGCAPEQTGAALVRTRTGWAKTSYLGAKGRHSASLLVLMAVSIWLVAVGGCGNANSAVQSRPRRAGERSRDCPGQRLTCEQLVALGLSYPYKREPGSYLYVNGAAYAYVSIPHRAIADASVRLAGRVVAVRALLERLGLARQADIARTPVIAYGSNANVAALTRKFVTSSFAGAAVIPVIKGALHGFDVTWSPQFVFNGAMPATIVPSLRTTVSVWVTWLNRPELRWMNMTEHVGTLYSYGWLRGARFDAAGPRVRHPGLYVDCFGALRVGGRLLALRGVAARHRNLPAVDSARALALVAPVIGWRGSVFDLLLDNVRFPARSERRNRTLEALGVQQPLPGYQQ